jgi:multidrug efflux pump subunit AcrA (membrane-fusion protein)
MKSRPYVLIPVLLLAFLIGYRLVQKRNDFSAQSRERVARMKVPPTVSFGLARVQDVYQRLDSVGSVEAPLSVRIAAKVTGRINYLDLHEGDRVGRGQVLVRVDPTQVEAQVREAEAALAEAQYRLAQARITQNPTEVSVATQVHLQEAAVQSAQANLANAQKKLERAEELYRKGFIAAQDVDDASTAVGVQQAALDQARASLDYAKANTAQKPAYEQSLAALRASVDAAQAGVRSAKSLRADTVLTAPFDGFVTGRYLDPGAVVTAGQPILAVEYMRQVWVTVSLPEEVSGKIRLGQVARVNLDSIPGRTFYGKVTQINPSADPTSRQFLVRVTLDNPDFALKPGSYAHLQIETDAVRGVLVVPREAVQHDKQGSYVMVLDDGNVVHRRPVTLGTSAVDVIAVTSGLRPGERVVTLTAYPLKDGQTVSTGEKTPSGGGKQGRGGRS